MHNFNHYNYTLYFLICQQFFMHLQHKKMQTKKGRPFWSTFLNLLVSNVLSVNFCHVSDKFKNFVRVTDFVVVPRYNFNECIS